MRGREAAAGHLGIIIWGWGLKGAEAVPQTTGPHMWTPLYTCLLKDIQPVRDKGVWVEFRVPR